MFLCSYGGCVERVKEEAMHEDVFALVEMVGISEGPKLSDFNHYLYVSPEKWIPELLTLQTMCKRCYAELEKELRRLGYDLDEMVYKDYDTWMQESLEYGFDEDDMDTDT